MGLIEIAVGLILILFLGVMTLMINPPERWVKKITENDKDTNDRK
jgi:hypothetical protein